MDKLDVSLDELVKEGSKGRGAPRRGSASKDLGRSATRGAPPKTNGGKGLLGPMRTQHKGTPSMRYNPLSRNAAPSSFQPAAAPVSVPAKQVVSLKRGKWRGAETGREAFRLSCLPD